MPDRDCSPPGSVSLLVQNQVDRLFGSARCLREGGSLTVIAVMNNDPASKLDEAIINDFRGAANMELTLATRAEHEELTRAVHALFREQGWSRWC